MRKQKLKRTSAADRTVAEGFAFSLTLSLILIVVIKLSSLLTESIVDDGKVTRAHSLVVEAILVAIHLCTQKMSLRNGLP